MKKNYQTSSAPASISELQLPEAVTLAMAELAGAVKEGLLALAVGAGLQVPLCVNLGRGSCSA